MASAEEYARRRTSGRRSKASRKARAKRGERYANEAPIQWPAVELRPDFTIARHDGEDEPEQPRRSL